jgi:hypothetical protein
MTRTQPWCAKGEDRLVEGRVKQSGHEPEGSPESSITSRLRLEQLLRVEATPTGPDLGLYLPVAILKTPDLNIRPKVAR